MKRERFTIELEAMNSPVPVPIRLRRLLKIALRSLDLKCTKIIPAAPDGNLDNDEATL